MHLRMLAPRLVVAVKKHFAGSVLVCEIFDITDKSIYIVEVSMNRAGGWPRKRLTSSHSVHNVEILIQTFRYCQSKPT